jgi:hypothetical protein
LACVNAQLAAIAIYTYIAHGSEAAFPVASTAVYRAKTISQRLPQRCIDGSVWAAAVRAAPGFRGGGTGWTPAAHTGWTDGRKAIVITVQ